MSAAELTSEQRSATTAIPPEIESTGSKLVYLYLHTVERATVEELQRSLRMKQLALFPYLETLVDDGLVERDGRQYVCSA